MADSKISALTDGTTPASTDAFAAARSGGTTVKLTWAELMAAGAGAARIFDSTLGASAASFDVTSIPGSYSHLIISYTLRDDQASVISNINLRFNNDSAANYDGIRLVANATSVATSQSGGQTSILQAGYSCGSSADAGQFGSGMIWIPNYAAGSTAFRTAIFLSGEIGTGGTTANYALKAHFGAWRSTAAITRVTILPQGSNFVAASRVTVYGML